MKTLNKKILIFAMIISFITAYLAYDYLNNIQQGSAVKETATIPVASRDILPGETISENMITEIKVPESDLLNMGIRNIGDISGKIAKEKIIKGESIPDERLLQDGETHLPFLIPEGKRAISIAIDEFSGVADLIKPNDFVDIYVTVEEKVIDMKDSKIVHPKTSILLLQNIQVIAVSKEVLKKKNEREDVPEEYAVTVAVKPSDGEKLVLGEEMGNIKLALRGIGDDSIHYTPGVIREDLVTEKGKVVIYK